MSTRETIWPDWHAADILLPGEGKTIKEQDLR